MHIGLTDLCVWTGLWLNSAGQWKVKQTKCKHTLFSLSIQHTVEEKYVLRYRIASVFRLHLALHMLEQEEANGSTTHSQQHFC